MSKEYTYSEAAELLRISNNTLHQWKTQGHIQYRKKQNRNIITEDEIKNITGLDKVEQLYTLKDLAAIFDLHPEKLREFARIGELSFIRLLGSSKSLRIPESEAKKFLEKKRVA